MMGNWFWYYLLLCNLTAFCACWWDKKCAREHKRRVPERRLFLFSFMGGAVGMYAGMLLFRHKTKHWYFMLGVPAIALCWTAVLWFFRGNLGL